jgi:DnaJ domain
MKNFYDLLGARPDDDAETLRKAYRKAAKASHPDHHGGDQDAAAQFRQILETIISFVTLSSGRLTTGSWTFNASRLSQN